MFLEKVQGGEKGGREREGGREGGRNGEGRREGGRDIHV